MLISVIVPVYNIEKDYLKRCINSILYQTYRDFELILVDDGSTDGSADIIDEYASNDSRVVALHKSNGGSSSARNMGISVAQGEYLSFIDSDDYIEPNTLETLAAPILRARELETYKHEGDDRFVTDSTFDAIVPLIVQVGRDERDSSGKVLPDICTPPRREEFIESKEFLRTLLMHIGDCSFCTKLTAKSLFAYEQFPEGKLNEDFRLLVHMLPEAGGVYSLPGYFYHVFYRLDSNTRKKTKNEFSRVYQDCIDNADEITEIVERHYPDLAEVALRFNVFQRIEYMLHIPIANMKTDYPGYEACVQYLKNNWGEALKNKYLTKKNKLYMTLFAFAPKLTRVVHAKIRHI